MVSRHSLIILLVIFISGCSRVVATPMPSPALAPGASVDQAQDKPASVSDATRLPERALLTPAPPTEAPPLHGISAGQIRNSQYQLGAVDALRVVQLTDGAFQQGAPGGADYLEVRVTDFIALGDIDGDGVNESAAIVAENYGGTGVFVFLALYVERAYEPVFLTSVFIDDRPVIDGVGFEKGQVFLNSTTHDADDPSCCPTLKNERHYRLINNQLEMTDYATFTPDDRPRTITIRTPVDGMEVSGSFRVEGNVAIAPFENNLTYRLYDLGGVELSAGAITVAASDLGAPGTFEATIRLGRILSSATIRLEVQDISAVDGSLFAMDSVELVVK